MFGRRKGAFSRRWLSEQRYQEQRAAILKQVPIPVIWLLGKTGSGKTSVVRLLTGAAAAEIGNGFQPQTRLSRQYDFPSSEQPLIRFLDTRGLGEVHYDPTEDLARFNESTHVVLVTVRAMDHALGDLLETLRAMRRAQPERPVLLVLTCLHEAYPHEQHPQPDPFGPWPPPETVSPPLRRSLLGHADAMHGLVDTIIPVDITRPEEGYQVPDFGGQRLKQAVLDALPAAYRQTLLTFEDALESLADLEARRAAPYIVSYSLMAASAAAVPVPWVDIPVVAAIQTHLVYQLARTYQQPRGAREVLKLIGPLGGRALVQVVVRESLKLIPFVGMAMNAATAYAYTHGMGKACCWYFGRVKQGCVPRAAELQTVLRDELLAARRQWEERQGAKEPG